jgi:transposase InsO family protein
MATKDTAVLESISELCQRHKRRYGYRRITSELEAHYGLVVNHKRVLRIMRENGLLAKIRRKKYIHYKPDMAIKKPDLIHRKFKADRPNQKWYTDVSELPFGESKLYLSAIIDGFNNEVVSYAISGSANLELAYETVRRAVKQKPSSEIILHSDQGSLYTSPSFQSFTKNENIVQSMGHKGVWFDNVLIESFFSHLKTEAFYSQNFTATNEQIIEIVGEYINYYNNERIQMKLNSLPPIKYREQAHTA